MHHFCPTWNARGFGTIDPKINNIFLMRDHAQVRNSIVVNISACHAEAMSSIPGGGGVFIPVAFSRRDLPRVGGASFSSLGHEASGGGQA